MPGIKWFVNAIKDRIFPPDYSPEEYWEKRLSKNFNLVGVGNKRLSERKNEELYQVKKEIVLRGFKNNGIKISDIKIADVGCGVGYWTSVFKENGCKDYLGIDISESAVERLKVIFPEYRFICANISELKIEEKFDLVFMIDVTQHIVDDEKFKNSMGFVKGILNDNGYLFVTSWLKNGVRNTYYEKSRGIEYYKEIFSDYNFSEPLPFSDKFLMVISKNSLNSLLK